MKGGDQQQLNLPAGFRFHPTDEELVVHYLCRRCAGQQIPAPVVAEIDLYKFNPWELPGMSFYGEKEWYFFSHRDRKYPNGSRPKRAAGTGCWKATGADKPVGKPKTLAIKKALVFYAGKVPRGVKTNWIMHEYRLANVDRSTGKSNNLMLDDWVLCRIYNKKGAIEKHYFSDHEAANFSDSKDQKSMANFSSGRTLTPAPPMQVAQADEYMHFDTSESIPKLHTDSSSSDHALSPDFKEVQSEAKWIDFHNPSDFQLNFIDAGDPFGSEIQFGDQMFLFQEMFGCTPEAFFIFEYDDDARAADVNSYSKRRKVEALNCSNQGGGEERML